LLVQEANRRAFAASSVIVCYTDCLKSRMSVALIPGDEDIEPPFGDSGYGT
jgi:hypothetical protein